MIYLDNASTTKPSLAVCEAVNEALVNFGNPSSMHRLGIDAENIIKKARENVADILSCSPKNIYFTSGGTESNNTAIFGAVLKNMKRGKHIITSKVEHPSVLEPFKKLEENGFSVSYINLDSSGKVDLKELDEQLREDTIFVSIMYVNNETGAIMEIEKIKDLMRKKSQYALLHVDAVQGFGKLYCNPQKWGIDLLSASAHKIHGIKGTGILYIRDNVNINPFIIGGGQQSDMRSGTENTVGIYALSKACEQIKDYNKEHIKELREYLKNGIIKNIDRVRVNEADEKNQAPHILNVSFMGVRSEILLHSLEMYDIYVSTGSACSTNKPMKSHVLNALGCSAEEIDGALRFSFCEDLSKEDMDIVINALVREVGSIRKYTRK